MRDGGEGSLVNMYAQLDSQEMPIPKDMSDYWQDPSSYFLISGDPRASTPCHAACCCPSCGCSLSVQCMTWQALDCTPLHASTVL